jgi:hypothetical protein
VLEEVTGDRLAALQGWCAGDHLWTVVEDPAQRGVGVEDVGEEAAVATSD